MSFKDISYLKLWQPLCSVNWNHLCNIGRRHHTEQFCEFGSAVQEEIMFKRFLIWSSGGPPVRSSGTIYAILKECIMGNIHVKFYEFGTNGSGDFF